MTGLRSITTQERLELGLDRICRVDITHPECPSDLNAASFKGRLPGRIWATARERLNADEQVGKQHSSLLKASFVYVQRPVALANSIVMLVQRLRRIEGAPRQLLFYAVVRTDADDVQYLEKWRRPAPQK